MHRSVLTAAALVILGSSVALADSARVTPSPGTSFSIAGTTNVGTWRCRGEHLDLAAVVAASAEEVEQVVTAIDKRGVSNRSGSASMPRVDVRLTIPVRTLQCGNPRMERDMYDALRAGQHKNITFVFENVTSVEMVSPRTYEVGVEGILKLGGVERRKQLFVTIEHPSRMRFTLRGELPMRMSDFEVEPPVALMGLIRANDPITVRFTIPLTLR